MTVPKLTFATLTDVGINRQHNEDACGLSESASAVVVADGMGGHSSGEIASALVVKSLIAYFETRSKGQQANEIDDNDVLAKAIQAANHELVQYVRGNPRHRGVGTTVVCLLAGTDGIYLAHVGDSRAYRVRCGELEQMTEDHSLLNDYLKTRIASAEEIARFPKNVIVRAVGMTDELKVDLRIETPQVGDA